MLVKQYHETNCVDKEVLVDIEMAVEASPELRSKRTYNEFYKWC